MNDAVPLSLALVAGALTTVNPCGLPVLTAFVSYYVGAGETDLPRASSRMAQGLLTGLLVSIGFLGVFAIVGVPVVYGATLVARAVPWAGIVTGVVLVTLGLTVLAGRSIGGRLPAQVPSGRRRTPSVLLFGAGYGIASLSCTLPLFLTVVGASLGTGDMVGSLAVFSAYGLGGAVMLTSLSVGAALLRQGLARALGTLAPHLPRLTGGMLTLAGVYLAYYWWQIQFAAPATIAADPLIGFVSRFTARMSVIAERAGRLLPAVAALAVSAALGGAWLTRRKAAERGSSDLPLGRGQAQEDQR